MTRIYHRKKDQEKRRYLRKNMPKSEVLLWTKLKNRQMHGERKDNHPFCPLLTKEERVKKTAKRFYNSFADIFMKRGG